MKKINLEKWANDSSIYILKYMNVCRDIQVYESKINKLSDNEKKLLDELKIEKIQMNTELKKFIDSISNYNLL